MSETTTAPAQVQEGIIFKMSWGYDQTNVNYFQVTRVTKAGVFVREIASVGVPNTQGFMCESVVPDKDHFLTRSQWCSKNFDGNAESFHRLTWNNGEPRFKIKGHYFVSLWSGKPDYCSWYA